MKYLIFLTLVVTTSTSASILNNILPTARPGPLSPYNNQVYAWVNQVLTVLGANSILDGTRLTNQGPLRGPLNAITPSSEETRHYIKLAASAYCPRNLETWTCPWCLPGYRFNGTITNDVLQTLVYFAVNDQRKEILVSYRGSQNILNFVLDFLPVPVDAGTNGNGTGNDEQIKIHGGLKLMTESLYPHVIERLQILTSVYPSYKVVFTGHSLGADEAAISVFKIFYSKLEFLTSRTIELYTYGLNRIGNRPFADFMNNLSIKIGRVVSRADSAPRITSPAALGYYHFQHEIWIYDILGNGTDKNCSTAVYEDPNCSDSLGPFYSFVDHFTYYDVDILICYALQDPLVVLLDFIAPLKQFIPKPLLDAIPILPIQEGGPVADALRTVTQFLG